MTSENPQDKLLYLAVKTYLEKNPDQVEVYRRIINNVKDFVKDPKTINAANAILSRVRDIKDLFSNPEFQKKLVLFLQLPEKRRKAILNMSETGWFPFEESIYLVPNDGETIDEYMTKVIDTNYDSLKSKILERYNTRISILATAFKLLEEENHIAAIPLFLTQIDGISEDNLGEYFFTGENKFPKLLSVRAKSEWDEHTYDLLKTIIEKAQKTFISSRFDRVKGNVNEVNILNRNGILHGDSDFLNYGNKTNTFKVLSLLLYVDWMSEFLTEAIEK